MSITNLTGTKWAFNNKLSPEMYPRLETVKISGKVYYDDFPEGTEFGSWSFLDGYYGDGHYTPEINADDIGSYPIIRYEDNINLERWEDSDGKVVSTPTVLFESGEGCTNLDFISFILNNATQIVEGNEEFLNKLGLNRLWNKIKEWIRDYVKGEGVFVLNTSAPCSYNELQEAINTPNAVLVRHEGGVYPFVEKWETDENNKRFVNIASLQRQGVDKGALYFFFEATIGDLDSPMVYSSNFAQPTGKPYADSIIGNLSNLATTEKANLVGAVNEVNGKVGFNVAVNQERWVGTYTDENDVVYQVYSKQIYIPALPATPGITAYEHGIDNIKQILDIYGSTTDGFVLNAPRQTVTDNITIYQASRSASNKTFSIEVGKDRSNKKAYVTVVYAKNN